MLTTQEIATLRAQVEQERQAALAKIEAEYRTKLDAIEIVSGMIQRPAAIEAPVVMAPREEPVIYPAPEGQRTLIEEIGKVISESPNQSWDVKSVEQALQAKGFVFESRQPKGGINTSLAKLVKRGQIRIIRHGKGRKPSTYRASIPHTSLNGAVAVEQDQAGELFQPEN